MFVEPTGSRWYRKRHLQTEGCDKDKATIKKVFTLIREKENEKEPRTEIKGN